MPLHNTPGRSRDPSICARRRLLSEGSGGGGVSVEMAVVAQVVLVEVAIDQHKFSRRGGGRWRQWLVICLATCAATVGTHCSLCGKTTVTGGWKREGKNADKDNWRSVSCCLLLDSGKRTTHRPLGTAHTWRSPYWAVGITKDPRAKYKHPWTLPRPFLFFLHYHLFYVSTPNFNGKSNPLKCNSRGSFHSTLWKITIIWYQRKKMIIF